MKACLKKGNVLYFYVKKIAITGRIFLIVIWKICLEFLAIQLILSIQISRLHLEATISFTGTNLQPKDV